MASFADRLKRLEQTLLSEPPSNSDSVVSRLQKLEEFTNGILSKGSLVQRVANLEALAFGDPDQQSPVAPPKSTENIPEHALGLASEEASPIKVPRQSNTDDLLEVEDQIRKLQERRTELLRPSATMPVIKAATQRKDATAADVAAARMVSSLMRTVPERAASTVVQHADAQYSVLTKQPSAAERASAQFATRCDNRAAAVSAASSSSTERSSCAAKIADRSLAPQKTVAAQKPAVEAVRKVSPISVPSPHVTCKSSLLNEATVDKAAAQRAELEKLKAKKLAAAERLAAENAERASAVPAACTPASETPEAQTAAIGKATRVYDPTNNRVFSSCTNHALSATPTPARVEENTKPIGAVDVLSKALHKSGGGEAAAKFAVILRAWAREGRPYRGRVFSLEEVEAAVSTVAKAAETARLRSSGPKLSLKAPAGTWPPRDLLSAVAHVTNGLGSLPPGTAEGAAGPKLLESLYELAAAPGRHSEGLVSLVPGCGEAPVLAHHAVLATASPMLAAKFSGRWGEAGSVDCTPFSNACVKASVSFAYLARCEVPLVDVGSLFGLADMLQLSDLLEALTVRIQGLSMKAILLSLEAWAAETPTWEFGLSVASALAASFKRATVELEMPGVHPDVGWKFVKELHDILAGGPAGAGQQLRDWMDDEELSLKEAIESFFMAALGAASAAKRSDFMLLCAPCVRAILPDASAVRLVERMCSTKGMTTETESLQVWLAWTNASCGHVRFSLLWDFYEALHRHQRNSVVRPHQQLQPAEELVPAPTTEPDGLPESLESDFARAFVKAIERDHGAAPQWEFQLLAQQGERLALEESMQLFVRLLRHSSGLLVGLSPVAVLCILRQAAGDLPSLKVRISQPRHVSGIYAKRSADGAYEREGAESACPGGAGPALLLKAYPRRGTGSLSVAWSGMPIAELKQARREWRLETADTSEEQAPLGVSLDEAEDPARILARWWLRGEEAAGRSFFSTETDLKLEAEAASWADAAPYVSALSRWAEVGPDGRRPGSLQEVERLAETEGGARIVLQLCGAARLRGTAAKRLLETVDGSQEESRKRRMQQA